MTDPRTPILLGALAAAALVAAAPSIASPAVTGCPSSDAHVAVSHRPGAAATLVPAGATSVVLCQYNGLDPANEIDRLTAGRLLRSRANTTTLATDLDAIPATTGVVFHCPADTGSSIVAYFRYKSGPADPVTVGLTGCELVSNGHVHRTAGVSASGRTAVSTMLTALHPKP